MLIEGLAILAVALSFAQATGETRGVVLDFSGGEPMARVQVELSDAPYRTVTDAQGPFLLR